MNLQDKSATFPRWYQSLAFAAGAAILYQFFEWLFFATKLSFLSRLGLSEKVEVLLLSSAVMVAFTVAAQLLLLPVAWLIRKRKPGSPVALLLMAIIASLVLSCLAFMLLDNFTYVLFRVGVITTGTVGRLLYVVIFCTIVVLMTRAVMRRLQDRTWTKRAAAISTAVAFLAVAVAVVKGVATRDGGTPFQVRAVSRAPRPNILFLGSDGVSADRTSLYGYPRDTTPFLRSLRARSLFCENAFPNVGRTYGSLLSMLSGVPSEATKTPFPPNILLGNDSFKHLPAMLRELGYSTSEVSMRYYSDAPDANMLLGFDYANYRDIDHRTAAFIRDRGLASVTPAVFFLRQTWERIADRLRHIFGIRRMEDAYAFVIDQQETPYFTDATRLPEISRIIETATRPWFLHVHLMDTHCCGFGQGRRLNAQELNLAYDRALLQSDRYIAFVFRELQRTKQLDNTIVVISSDHNVGWDTRARVPLMLYFPKESIRGHIKENVQLLDVAPTILDALDVAQPEWMKGKSLLTPLSPVRPIHSLNRVDLVPHANNQFVKELRRPGPPHFGASTAVVVICDRWYELNLHNGRIRSEPVAGHSGSCPPPASMEDARRLILEHLRANGFGSLPPEKMP